MCGTLLGLVTAAEVAGDQVEAIRDQVDYGRLAITRL